MIPKIIHYCWLSNDPIPDLFNKCMNTWREKMPDYDLVRWDFERFEKNSSTWVSEAYERKKYAFAADYIRLFALYTCGGIYLDMDVEVLRPFDDFLALNAMLSRENSIDGRLEVAVMGAEKESEWVKACLDYYNSRSFVKKNGELDTRVLPLIVMDQLARNNYALSDVITVESAQNLCGQGAIPVFPHEFFSPKSYATGEIATTDNTFAVHHFSGSWKKWYDLVEAKAWNLVGISNMSLISRSLQRLAWITRRAR